MALLKCLYHRELRNTADDPFEWDGKLSPESKNVVKLLRFYLNLKVWTLIEAQATLEMLPIFPEIRPEILCPCIELVSRDLSDAELKDLFTDHNVYRKFFLKKMAKFSNQTFTANPAECVQRFEWIIRSVQNIRKYVLDKEALVKDLKYYISTEKAKMFDRFSMQLTDSRQQPLVDLSQHL